MSAVFISRSVSAVDGGGQLTERNRKIVNSIGFDGGTYFFEVSVDGYYEKLVNSVLGRPYGFGRSLVDRLKSIMLGGGVQCVFIEHSLLAGYARYIKRWNPDVPIFIFYHNVEFHYYLHKSRVESIFNVVMLLLAWRNESIGRRFADHHVVLTRRDGMELKRLYGIDRAKVIPISLPYLSDQTDSGSLVSSGYHLYVGSNFFANIDGLCWYIENVLPYMKTKLVVVGKGMEFLRSKYPAVLNLEILGYVEDLTGFYRAADFFVNPVFVGSGMKTKTVEAFRHAKTVLGCKEAFVGFDIDFSGGETAFLCETAEQYSSAENEVLSDIPKYKFNASAKAYFSCYLSDEVVAAEFRSYFFEVSSNVSP
ncbi:glycosyltransferase [Pseudomonas sihuiensis]|uniref:Glycosyltransferase involved in cell wall bisynthesis n=1 Tax=Pseudomonas sihuiensis TaxID=1274359 RepID=A0A1H2L8X5_9PSED|nr:glycosyltransferase [Pseudomonas sihuiensis]SDU77497.1 Glycosyltransferase involved in cell wall bisynthesis [Pseudomonas sihuiensis]